MFNEEPPKVKIHSWNLLFIVLEINTENSRWKRLWVKQTETRQYCTLSVLLFSEVVKLKRLWLCICCWKHKDHMCALYPWWILLDDSRGLCKRATLCCSPAASLACEDSPHWLQRPTLFSVPPQHGNTDALSCKHRSRLQILQKCKLTIDCVLSDITQWWHTTHKDCRFML